MRWFDSHAHFDETHTSELSESIDRSVYGVDRVLIAGVSPDTFSEQVRFCLKNDFDFSLGIHPWFMNDESSLLLERLRSGLRCYEPRALGECGLDKVRGAPWNKQEELFEAQLYCAQEFDLPVVIHSVRAHHHVLNHLKRMDLKRKGVVHGFYGNTQQALGFIELGYKIGIGLLICHERSKKLRKVVQDIPLESIVLETDLPINHFEKYVNGSYSLLDVARTIADVRGESLELVSEVTYLQAEVLFSK